MEDLIERLNNIAFIIGCNATQYDTITIEEVFKTIDEVKAALLDK